MVTRQSGLVLAKGPCKSCQLLIGTSPGLHNSGTGIGNGSTFRTIGVIFDRVQAGPVLGWTSAVAAYGSFIAPVVIGAQVKAGTTQYAMYGFAVFYALCLLHNWWFYLRKNAYVKNP